MKGTERTFQDWMPVVLDKRGEKRVGETKERQIERMRRDNPDLVATKTKSTCTNAPVLARGVTNLRKIETEEETFKLPTVSKTMAQRIAKARCEKRMSQKDLAMSLNLSFKIVKDYESTIALPNHLVINKMEKILETRLRD